MKSLEEFANAAQRARRERPPTVNVADRVMAVVACEGGELEPASLTEWLLPLVAATLSVAAAAIILVSLSVASAPASSDPLVTLAQSFDVSVD